MAFAANAAALVDDYINETICRLHGWYANFYIAANFWMIAIIAYQIHKMLRVTQKCQRYKAPSKRYIVKQSLAVYVFAGLFAAIYQIGNGESGVVPPITLVVEIVCIPIPFTPAQKWFNYLFMWGLSGIVPSIYILSVAFDIWRRKLLPKNQREKTRQIALYYMRLIVVFLIIWVAFITLHFVGGWPAATAAFIYDLTGIVSVSFALTKKDIITAFFGFLKWIFFCQTNETNNADGHKHSSTGMGITTSIAGVGSSSYMISSSAVVVPVMTTVVEETGVVQHDEEQQQPQHDEP
eukprot:CAMPEP_0194248396 /NCGR_PEP_ID=MMETSP0158-20130606/18273_1 /TAXON_ID=33649 /ORGANISM="Thalassionema nitzschioides, Strain L26-B" /LENGTH=293 /DNA_ID=CAMNT_0038984689 /DNA_START=111 /DNA_END=989 /DNA_ORIENTATION=-